ncbi:hypothetical protein GQ53DRAFT_600533, partial [Thozetella sp. PMI_491]
KAQQRVSASSLPVTLPILPFTHGEWKKTITEIKRMHLTRRYRLCATRCAEILDNLKDKTHVEPVYLVYLHFYAALSLEMCARPLAASPYQTSLFDQARTHFDRASELIQAAEAAAPTKPRAFSVLSSRSSSCHSPSESISSRAWTVGTSPTNSVCSFEDLSSKAQKSKRAKKVSFSLPLPQEEEEPVFRIPEPYIRPDSPTLGFEDDYFHAGAARQELPELPQAKPIELPLQSEVPLLPEDDDMFMARSVSRYCETLADLKTQLANHAASLHESRRGSIIGPLVAEKEDLRVLDRQARIERLRKSGWQRKRFDARRYEELCDAVMAELA